MKASATFTGVRAEHGKWYIGTGGGEQDDMFCIIRAA